MNKVTLHDAFTPRGCEGTIAPSPAVTAEAGAVWIDLYHAVTSEAGRYVQGGGCADVGVAGLIQSGGFGSFSKGFGAAAAGLLEAEIVTADGAVRIANACTNPDLFWALKGGGGGSWGVVTRVTLRTHDLPAFFGGVWGSIKAQSDDAFRRLIASFLSFYVDNLFNPHWGEQIALGPDDTLTLSMVCQGLDNAQARAVWQPLFDWAAASPQDFALSANHGAGALPARRFWDVAGNPFMVADPRAGAPNFHGWWRGDQEQAGMFLHGYESLWLPATLLQDAERGSLADALVAASHHKKVGLHFNKGLAGAPGEAIAAARDTATNPGMTEAFALAIIAGGRVRAILACRGPPSMRQRRGKMRKRSTRPPPNCAGSPRTLAPMCLRAITSTPRGKMRFGDRTIRACVRSKRNTTQAASSSRTTASAARIGPPMGSPGDETGLCDVRLQRSVAIDRFRRAAAVERQILTPRDAPSSMASPLVGCRPAGSEDL